MNKLPLRKCPQCRQVKREDIIHICQACYAANEQEFDEQEARSQGMPTKPPMLNRNLIDYPYFNHTPALHEYMWYWWRHLPEKHRLLLLALLTSCIVSNSLTLMTHGVSGAWILADCIADMYVVVGAIIYFNAKCLFRWLITFCKNVWGGLATFLRNVQQLGRSLAYPFVSDEQDDALPFPLGESGTLPPQHPLPDRPHDILIQDLRVRKEAFRRDIEERLCAMIEAWEPASPSDEQILEARQSHPPLSPYTGQPYDPAWFSETGGGQSNTALLTLMKRIEQEIEERKAGMPKDEPEYAQVQAMYPEERA